MYRRLKKSADPSERSGPHAAAAVLLLDGPLVCSGWHFLLSLHTSALPDIAPVLLQLYASTYGVFTATTLACGVAKMSLSMMTCPRSFPRASPNLVLGEGHYVPNWASASPCLTHFDLTCLSFPLLSPLAAV